MSYIWTESQIIDVYIIMTFVILSVTLCSVHHINTEFKTLEVETH